MDVSENRDSNSPSNVTGQPQYFSVISLKTKYIIDQQITPSPVMNYEEMLLAIHDFISGRPNLEWDEVCFIKLDNDSILIESMGTIAYIEAFSGEIDKSHYDQFSKAIRHIQDRLPELWNWDGIPRNLPDRVKITVRNYFNFPVGRDAALPISIPPDIMHDIQNYKGMLKEYYQKGYNIDRLKEALYSDWNTLVGTFDGYAKDVRYLDMLGNRIRDLNEAGFEEDIKRLEALLKNPSKIKELEEGLDASLVL